MMANVMQKSGNKFIYESCSEEGILKKELFEVSIKHQIWQDLNHFIILPFSIHSAIYNGERGSAKITALIKTVKQYAKNKILILLCEGAHLHFLSRQLQCSLDEAFMHCRNDAELLVKRFSQDFSGCELAYWREFVFENQDYNQYKLELMRMYQEDKLFYDLLNNDVDQLEQIKMIQSVEEKNEYVDKARLDYIEMMVGIRVMHEQLYKTQIYPGLMPESFMYARSFFYPDMLFINANIRTKVCAKESY